ncbi:MAG TPA: MurT ligase domain-containing protein, partial [Acidimicrobiales bacterium]|nr:MurT ligase domain-containing protein [Acidimicrobiales bacterium]
MGRTSRRLRLGGGSVIGGRVGLVVDPHLLEVLGGGRRVALVTGTNGKTTTTTLLAAALGGPGAVATSAAGANLPAGLAAALAAAPAAQPAVLEVDEGYLGRAVDALHPEVVVLLNLSRDQLDRVNEVRMVAARWRDVVAGDRVGTIVANADDPLVVWAAEHAARVVWVAAGQRWRADAMGCPSCDGRLEFGADGVDWWCACGFRRPAPDVEVPPGRLVAGGADVAMALSLPGRCNESNAAMAAAAAAVLGVGHEEALAAMARIDEVAGRFALVEHAGVRARLLLAKNPAGWAELLDMVDGGTDPVVVGINARIADGHDPSWLWDVPFERLRGRAVVATGERCRDLAVRLRYAGVDHRVEPDQLLALAAAGADRVEYAGNYTAFQALRRSLARAGAKAGGARPGATSAAPELRQALAVPPILTSGSVSGPGSGSTRGPKDSALRVVIVHPDLLGTYGDGGNGLVLAGRALARGMAVEVVLASSADPLPASGDLYCLGGGEDGPQVRAAERLRDGALARAVEGGAAVLAVCAGYQVVGRSFPGADGSRHEGVGLLDVTTDKTTSARAVGEILAEPIGAGPGRGAPGAESAVDAGEDRSWSAPLGMLTGFVNHGGRTTLGPGARPLAVVRAGIGNGAGDGTEGAWAGKVIGTYLHGPVLARNPALADLLLGLATGG